MSEIQTVRRLTLWIFFLPVIAINLCLLISVNYHLFEETIFTVDQIGRSGFTIPYLDGSLSISRASRTFPQYLIFKPSMVLASIVLIFYWINYNRLINKIAITNINYKFKIFGILSAILLIIHSIFLGIEADLKIIKFLRRVVLLGFIIFELAAQANFLYYLNKLKSKIDPITNINILRIKIAIVILLIVIAIASVPILVQSGNTHFKHGLEWNYFIGVVFFYFLTYFYWKRS